MEFILGILHLVLIIWALLKIFGSGASTGAKILWALLVIIFPIVGFLIWFFAGPK